MYGRSGSTINSTKLKLPVHSKNAGSMIAMEFNRQDINTIMQSKNNEYWKVKTKHLKKVLLVSISPCVTACTLHCFPPAVCKCEFEKQVLNHLSIAQYHPL
jgi:hypothetical protein